MKLFFFLLLFLIFILSISFGSATISFSNLFNTNKTINLGPISVVSSGSGTSNSSNISHNDLALIQGGITNEYYHLTNAEWINRIFLFNQSNIQYNFNQSAIQYNFNQSNILYNYNQTAPSNTYTDTRGFVISSIGNVTYAGILWNYNQTAPANTYSDAQLSLINGTLAHLLGGNNINGTQNFNSGWANGGLSIIGGDIYAQTGFFYTIAGLNISTLNANGSIIPSINNSFDIGNTTKSWRNGYFTTDIFIVGIGVKQWLFNQSNIAYNFNQSAIQYNFNQSNIQYNFNQSNIKYNFNQSAIAYNFNQSNIQ